MTELERDLKRLKKLYNKAVREGRDQFTFRGQPVLTSFAKYYIDYLEGIIERGKECHSLDPF